MQLKKPGFYIKLENCKFLISVLKSVHFKEVYYDFLEWFRGEILNFIQLVTVIASMQGLQITVEESKCVQGNLFLEQSMFKVYKVSKNCITFKINIKILIVT